MEIMAFVPCRLDVACGWIQTERTLRKGDVRKE